jgi:hypothetical protein
MEIEQKPNVGNLDKIIRLALGIAILLLGIIFKSWWGVVGIVPFFTGLFNFYPAYGLMGISTKSKVKTEKLKTK